MKPVRMIGSYGSNVPGEIATFPDDVAGELVKRKLARLVDPKAVAARREILRRAAAESAPAPELPPVPELAPEPGPGKALRQVSIQGAPPVEVQAPIVPEEQVPELPPEPELLGLRDEEPPAEEKAPEAPPVHKMETGARISRKGKRG